MGRILIHGEPGHGIVPELAADRRRDSSSTSRARARSTPPRSATSWRELGITHLVFAGVTTEVCVQTTMREANDRGFDCLLIEDATESYFPEFKAATLAMIRAQGGIVGWTAPLAALEAAVARGGGGMSAPFDAEAHVDHMAEVMGLEIAPEWLRPSSPT